MSNNTARKWNYAAQTKQPVVEQQVKDKVKKTSWITKGEKILYSLLGLFLIVAGAYIVSFSSSTDQLNRDVQALEDVVVSQQIENEGLLFEVNELSDPARITKIARDNGLKVQYAEVKRVHSLNGN